MPALSVSRSVKYFLVIIIIHAQGFVKLYGIIGVYIPPIKDLTFSAKCAIIGCSRWANLFTGSLIGKYLKEKTMERITDYLYLAVYVAIGAFFAGIFRSLGVVGSHGTPIWFFMGAMWPIFLLLTIAAGVVWLTIYPAYWLGSWIGTLISGLIH